MLCEPRQLDYATVEHSVLARDSTSMRGEVIMSRINKIPTLYISSSLGYGVRDRAAVASRQSVSLLVELI
jgi:hypothetical protein